MFSSKILKKIQALGEMMDAQEQHQWTIGDYLIELVDVDGVKLKDAAEWFAENGHGEGRSYSMLSRYYSNAKAFPPGKRRKDVPYEVHSLIRAGAKAISRNLAVQLDRDDVKIDPVKMLHNDKVVFTEGADNISRRSGRAVTKVINKIAQKQFMPQRQATAAKAIEGSPDHLIDHCHFGDYIERVKMLPDASIQLAFLDPPYGQYTKSNSGAHDMTVSAASHSACDANTKAEAIKVVVDAFPVLATKLRKGGVIALWQAGKALRKEILDAADASGFDVDDIIPVVWNKKRPQPGDHMSAVSLSVEFAWIIHRKGEVVAGLELANGHDNSERQQVYDWAPVHQSASSAEQKHTFEKPAEANDFFTDKFTVAGDLIVDCFGCTGSMCVSAITKGRRWMYCESNAENYALGSSRIAAEIENISAMKSA